MSGDKVDLKTIPVAKSAPLDKDNGAFLGYVTLSVAHDMEAAGMWMFAKALDVAGTKLVMEYGRLPPGLEIPAKAWDETYAHVVEMVKTQSLKAFDDPSGPMH